MVEKTPGTRLPRRPILPPKPLAFRVSRLLLIIVVCVADLAAFLGLGNPGSAAAREPKSEPGVSYKNERVASVPWSIHVLKIDRTRKDLTYVAAHAKGKVLGVSLIAEQARTVPPEIGRAIAGVNGDFYERENPTYAGDPRGLQLLNGELISGPSTVCVWFDADDNPHLDEVKGDFKVIWPEDQKTSFGLNQQRRSNQTVLYTPTYGASTRGPRGREVILERSGDSPWLPLQASQTYLARVREVQTNGNARLPADVMVLALASEFLAGGPKVVPGVELKILTTTTPELKGVRTAIAGGPALIQNGKTFSAKTPGPAVSRDYSERSRYERHPRSAVGWSPTHVYLVTVDGRQPGLSAGMTLAELAEYMSGLGCTEAMNLDGGKSAQMWVTGQIMNSPCQGEDTVANSLLVVRKPAAR